MSNIAVIGAQWGDEGKGKVVDLLSERFDVNVEEPPGAAIINRSSGGSAH